MRPLLLFLFLALLTIIFPAARGQTLEILFEANQGWSPAGRPVLGRDGNLYGTTIGGGASDNGTVFKLTPDGKLTTLVSFNGINGSSPSVGLLLGMDGNFYGVTYYGGVGDRGTVFKVTPAGELTTLVSFNGNNGSGPLARLVQGSDGNLYGTTIGGGASGNGTVFKVTPGGELTTLVSFNRANGSGPYRAELVEGSDGSFYGTTTFGGTNNSGTAFKVTPSGEHTLLVSFNGNNGTLPRAGLAKGDDGNFYGTTAFGGTIDRGTVFRMTPAGQLTTICSFDGTNGIDPGDLVRGSDGSFYGTTSGGGAAQDGTIFKVTPSGELTTLISFNDANGRYPSGGLEEIGGNFYGTTDSGGTHGYGTVFKVTSAGQLATLVSFNITSTSGLLEGSNGDFYGTTSGGGASNSGTVFKMTPAGELTTLVSFDGANGSEPLAKLLEGSDGYFYGTTSGGGAYNSGTVFKMTPAGELTTLASFDGTNGRSPGMLVEGSDGCFYGTTSGGGAYNSGTVFKMTPAGELTTLNSFGVANGGNPAPRLIKGGDGNFYGTTSLGGAYANGTAFKVTLGGNFTTLVSFNNGSPNGDLVEGLDGNFYGTAYQVAKSGYSTIFKLTPTGELTTLARADGASFSSGLIQGTGGNFYGTGNGSVFEMTPAGKITSLVSFHDVGGVPNGGLTKGLDGNLYGVTSRGGASGKATIFRVTPAGGVTTLYSFDGSVADYPRVVSFGSDGKLYGTLGGKVIWRLWLASAPNAITTVPSAITKNGATLSGWVNANGADATVTFEYGLTPDYGSSIVAMPGKVTGRETIAVNAALTNLAQNATYYYRITATNSEGTTSTTGGSFTTANNRPVATNDSFTPVQNDFGPISLAVLGNDSDVDGDLLTITGVTQGSFGTVSTDGATLTYTPRSGFLGRDVFSYTVSDGIDTATAQVELRSTSPFPRALLSNGSQVPGAGQPASGIPAGALFKSFGTPSINSAGRLAFTASYGAQGSPGEISVFVLDPQAVTSTLAARRGQAAPGTNGAIFSSFKDPLLNEAGDMAFLASLSGGDTTKLNNQGIWVSGPVGVQLVARTGALAPGASAGARWKTFTSVALAGDGIDTTSDGNGWSLAFIAFMAPGAGGVSAANDMGLWIASPSKTVLALREGQKLQIGGTEKKFRSFAALMPLSNALGQGNGVISTGGVAVQAFFTDGSQAMLRVSGPCENDNVTIEALALPADPVAGTAETAAKFGVPVQSSSGTATAWLGSLSGKSNPAAIFERNLSEPEILKLVARKGDAAPGIEGASFSAFRSVAVSDTGNALFLGKVSGRGISSSNDEGLWWKKSGDNLSLQLLAREGAQPPGVPEGARWSSFTSLALSEGPYGPLFTAKLVAGAKGKGPGKITSATDHGLWAVDSKGELQLVVQEGQAVNVEGSSTPKTLKSFTVLSAVPGSPAQRRSFAGDGQIVYRALFTDGSQAIVKVQLP